MRVVVESPLNADTPEGVSENLRYLLWCCRAVYLAGHEPIASHLICPWFMNDADPKERQDGINWTWMWQLGDPHWFFRDRGYSGGMNASDSRCLALGIRRPHMRLEQQSEECWAAYLRGAWPPHTKGFELFASHVERGEQYNAAGEVVARTVTGRVPSKPELQNLPRETREQAYRRGSQERDADRYYPPTPGECHSIYFSVMAVCDLTYVGAAKVVARGWCAR